MNSFDYYWMRSSRWDRLVDWVADTWWALRERTVVEQIVGATVAFVVVVVIGTIGVIKSATSPTVAYHGPSNPQGWAPLFTVDGRPKPNDHACGSMTYGIDPRNSRDPRFGRDAKYAALRIARASGIPLHYDGRIDGRSRDPGVDVSIRWAGSEEFFNVDAIGEAHANGGGGTILLADWLRDEPGRKGWGAVLLHEWGHIIGLAHVDEATSVMNGDGLGIDLNSADRDGLWALGRGSCR